MSRAVVYVLGVAMLVVASAPAHAQSKAYVYPKAGQSADQQGRDEYECHKWAVAQSGVDPGAAAAPAEGGRAGGTVRGAARGALLGAAVGGIVDGGDGAGKGAAIGAIGGGVKGRRGAVAGEQQAKAEQGNSYQRAFAACMEARNYTVK